MANPGSDRARPPTTAAVLDDHGLVDNSPDIVVGIRLDGTIHYVSPAVREVLGYELEEIVGKPLATFVHADDRAAVAASLSQSAAGTSRLDCRVRRRDQSFAWIAMASRVATDPATGAPVERVGTLRDVSKGKAREEELAKAKDATEAMHRADAQALAGMSHELRMPMHGIIGTAELLLGTDLDDRQSDYVWMLRESATDLLGLIDDILDMSKLKSGGFRLEHVDFDLRQVVWQCVDLMAPKAAQKGLMLDCTIEDGACRRFRGDPARLRQVLLNAIGTAIKFTDDGRVSVDVGAPDVADGEARLSLRVLNATTDISEEHRRRRLDEVGSSAKGASRHGDGTGLRLAMTRRLVKAMGGEFIIESQAPAGTRFHIMLRFALPSSGVALPHAVGDGAPVPCLSGEGKRILLAEDVFINAVIASDLLRGEAYEVEIAHDGREALEAIRAKSYDLVLMDIHMPGVDGFEATRQIRALAGGKATLPIIALTADNMTRIREEYLAAGFDDLLVKPFDPDTLFAIVARWTAGSSPRAYGVDDVLAANGPLLDERKVDILARDMQSERFTAFIERWLRDTAECLGKITACAEAGELELLKIEAGGLARSAATVGAVRLATLARGVEDNCAAGTVDMTLALARHLADAAQPTIDAMRQRLESAN